MIRTLASDLRETTGGADRSVGRLPRFGSEGGREPALDLSEQAVLTPLGALPLTLARLTVEVDPDGRVVEVRVGLALMENPEGEIEGTGGKGGSVHTPEYTVFASIYGCVVMNHHV